jgi:NitT/TauT family transport system ATP-binding protein
VVLEDVNLTLRPNEIVGLLGRSGSGKSTLLRSIAGLITPTAGAVEVRDMPDDSNAHGVSMVFQSFALFPWLTVQKNVELGLEAQGVPAEERRKRTLAAIDLIGLDGFENAYPKELSGGMRQRVGLARALVVQPSVLLMDEPFSAIDAVNRMALQKYLVDAWLAEPRTVIYVTHDIDEAVYLADRIAIMTSSPGHVGEYVTVDMARPRDRNSAQANALRLELTEIMRRLGAQGAYAGEVVPARR